MPEPTTLDLPGQVTCTSCNKTFECFHRDMASGCSADLTDKMRIHGHYGSAVADMTVYRFVSSHAWIEAGPLKPGSICDECITDLEDRGLIEEEIHY